MLDYRINTFLALCQEMNYRAAAEKLNITQPAVTQHIHYLESVYGCKLFEYNKKTLKKTRQCELLERHARAMLYNENEFIQELSGAETKHYPIGATRTIGEYVMGDELYYFLSRESNNVELIVDNTVALLELLDKGELDFALIEGYFDKNKYDFRLMKNEEFVGICSKCSPLAGREADFQDLFDSTLILRERGSGTREILENALRSCGYLTDNFKRVICANNFGIIRELSAREIGISFAYRAVADADSRLATFTIRQHGIVHEFNYVYLKNTSAEKKLADFISPEN